MRNNRGWLKIVEASIAIIMVLSALMVVYVKSGTPNQPDLSDRTRDILNEISLNGTLRLAILDVDPDNLVNQSIGDRIRDANVEYEVRICALNSACGKTEYTPGDVYVAERIISSYVNMTSQISPVDAKQIRLFMWRTSAG
jgi:hypothetical protein